MGGTIRYVIFFLFVLCNGKAHSVKSQTNINTVLVLLCNRRQPEVKTQTTCIHSARYHPFSSYFYFTLLAQHFFVQIDLVL